jgi:two-component system, LytTR family, response regulator
VRVLIVDDEPLARRGVALRLRKFPAIEVAGECGDGAAAVDKILELAPELVFLDVQMPAMNGFEVLRALPKASLPGVIFLTAYEQHALKAFEVHALDYLLKPVDDERFEAAVNRVLTMMHSVTKVQMAERVLRMLGAEPGNYLSRIAVRSGSRTQIVLVPDIEWIAAAGDYSELHARGRTHLLRQPLYALESKLDPRRFLRIHRSRIVCTACIVELRAIDNREYRLTLSDGSEHRSSRTYADGVEQWLTAEPAD